MQSLGVVPGIDGDVYSTTRWDPDGPGPATELLVFGGGFATAGGVPARNIATFDPANGTWSTLGTGISGSPVAALLALPNGELIAGGAFRVSHGAPGDHLARWNGTTWTGFGGLTPNGQGVTSLLLRPNGDIVVGGWFTAAGATVLNYLGVWNGTAWSSPGGGVNWAVRGMAELPNGDLVVGGYFSAAGGIAADGIARWDGVAWSSLGSVPAVTRLAALPNGNLVALGQFTQAGGVAANGIAQWNGTTWSGLGSGIVGNSGAAVAVLPNGEFVVGGVFQQVGGVPASCIARWNGTTWSALGTGVTGAVRAIAVLGNGDLVAGGDFGVAGGVPASRVARWNGVAWSAMAAGAAPEEMVYALQTLPDGSVVAGGTFQAIGGIVANGIARWNGASWSSLSNGWLSVQSMAVAPNGDLLVGAGGVSRWDGSSWSLVGTPLAWVRAVATLQNGDIVAGLSYGVERWDGVAWTSLGGGMGGEVNALALDSQGDLIAGGTFFWAGSTNTMNIARWNGTTWSTLGSGLYGPIGSEGAYCIAPLANGELIVGGWFSIAGGVPVNNIAMWNGTAWAPLGSGTNGPVQKLHRLPSGDFLVAGAFTQAGGVPVNNLARWNGSTWSAVGAGVSLWLSSTPPFTGGVRALAATSNGDILVGGAILATGGQLSHNLARIATTCPAAVQPLGSGCGGQVMATLPWTGSLWRADATGLPNAAVVLVVHGFSTTVLPLTSVFANALPGCAVDVSPDWVGLTTATAGLASAQFLLPNTPALAGVVFHHQMVSLDLGAALFARATNSLTVTVGTF